MGLVVQKYGGTSVGSIERIQAVAQRILGTIALGHRVVVVVSAMGKTTDSLVQLAQDLTDTPDVRDMDLLLATGEQVSIALLSLALKTLNQPARAMTGFQAGIMTEKHHGRARILEVKTERIHQALDQGEVVVVAGFQGMSIDDPLEITTLGRGGSDTSAVALAAALQADCCEIYTDVPGILSTDPRIVPEAHLMTEITCEEMLELASLGAKVLHPRAVEIARNYHVPLVVRSSWTADPGTQVLSPSVATVPRALNNLEIARPVDGIEVDRHQAKVGILHVPDRPGIAAHLFGALSQAGINIDLIIQSIHDGQSNDIAFTVDETQLAQAVEITAMSLAELMGTDSEQVRQQIQSDETIAKVSISGAGMIGRPGVAAQMFAALAAAGANIQMISTSEIKVSCVLNRSDADAAIVALRQTFELETSTETRMGVSLTEWGQTPKNPIPAVRGVALDENQAELAIRSVPDRPGMAAQIFGLLAKHLISVDMIIQSQRCGEGTTGITRDIACTVSKADALTAQAVLTEAMETLGFGTVEVNPEVAKVSIVGSGMVYQDGVAAKMFAALAQAQINIQMIGTSEIKTSCLVNAAQGKQAVSIIHKAFDLSPAS